MKLVTPEEMKDVDERAIDKLGIPGAVLMENAGLGLVEIIREEFESCPGGVRVGIICGKGNNGGDGFVLARHLLNNGANVTTFLLGSINEIKGDAKINLNILLNSGYKIIELKNRRQLGFDKSNPYDLLVDAIFGTGFKGKATGLASEIINIMNDSNIPILAVDVPSGLNALNGSIKGVCVNASFTGTMCLPKRGLFLYPGKDYAGTIYVIDIGVPQKLYENINLELLEEDEVKSLLPERPDDSNKGTFGKVFILAGSQGMTGAAALTSLSALKTGAGLVRLGIPESLNSILEEKVTEVITVPLPQTKAGTFATKGKDLILSEINKADVITIGPGLSTNHETRELIKELVPRIKKPIVIDADGLNNLTSREIKKIKAPVIITPHPGELSKLTGQTIQEIQAHRIDITFKVAKELGVTLVLKGAPTIIVSDGKGYLNPCYNSGLATGGTGDVLTGIITGLLAQGLEPVDSARLGVYIHGSAGDIAKEKFTEYSMIAGDVMDAIPDVIKGKLTAD